MLIFATILIAAVIAMIVYNFKKPYSKPVIPDNEPEEEEQEKTEEFQPGMLLSLSETTIAERQRYYRRDYDSQVIYDELQRQAEEAGDSATLEAIRTGTYSGKLPIMKPGGFTHYKSTVRKFRIEGISFRDQRKLAKCKGLFEARLVPEPKNEFDPNAIKIIHEGNIHVGYIPRMETDVVRSIATLPCMCFGFISDEVSYEYDDRYDDDERYDDYDYVDHEIERHTYHGRVYIEQ